MPSSRKTSLTIKIPLPLDACTEEELVTAAQRLARQAVRKLWRDRHPMALNKGGRPSLKDNVWHMCEAIWNESRRKKHLSVLELTRQVQTRLARKYKSDRSRAIEVHVRDWMRRQLLNKELPTSVWWGDEGKEIIKLGCRSSVLSHYLQHVIQSSFTLRNEKDRMAFQDAYKAALDHVDKIPIKELVRRTIQERNKPVPDEVLFSWLQTPSG